MGKNWKKNASASFRCSKLTRVDPATAAVLQLPQLHKTKFIRGQSEQVSDES
jgi:hypothetical protein